MIRLDVEQMRSALRLRVSPEAAFALGSLRATTGRLILVHRFTSAWQGELSWRAWVDGPPYGYVNLVSQDWGAVYVSETDLARFTDMQLIIELVTGSDPKTGAIPEFSFRSEGRPYSDSEIALLEAISHLG